jgi:hypothetical protein
VLKAEHDCVQPLDLLPIEFSSLVAGAESEPSIE